MRVMEKFLFLGIGGFTGTLGRYLVSLILMNLSPKFFYLATLMVNLSGSLLIGFISALFLKETFLHPGYRLFFITGVLGGFTTFSSFSIELLKLIQEERFLECALYFFISTAGGLAMAALGWQVSLFLTD